MTRLRSGMLLLLVQVLLVLSIAGKYLYERKTRPRVWARAIQFDPDQPLRGRYLALQLLLNACALPRSDAFYVKPYTAGMLPTQAVHARRSWEWAVRLQVQGGELVPVLSNNPTDAADSERLNLLEGRPCDRVPAQEQEEFFLPEHAGIHLPLPPGQELWVEVTVPAEGPPRPIQLAISDASGFHALAAR